MSPVRRFRGNWGPRQCRLTGEPVEDPVEGDIPIPTDLPLLAGEPLPGPARWHRAQPLLGPTVHRALVRRAMHARIHLPTPVRRLAVQVVQISEVHPWPEGMFDHADAALHFALRFGRIAPAHPRTH